MELDRVKTELVQEKEELSIVIGQIESEAADMLSRKMRYNFLFEYMQIC